MNQFFIYMEIGIQKSMTLIYKYNVKEKPGAVK